jgi:hypothetical protein
MEYNTAVRMCFNLRKLECNPAFAVVGFDIVSNLLATCPELILEYSKNDSF